MFSAGDYRLEERPIPEIGEGEVLVRILAVGICAGDAKCFAGAPYFWGEKLYRCCGVGSSHAWLFQVVQVACSWCRLEWTELVLYFLLRNHPTIS